MLVLSRKSQQSVMVGGVSSFQQLLTVTVLEICGSRVRLGFDVNAEVPVHRAEVWQRIHGETQAPDGKRSGHSVVTKF